MSIRMQICFAEQFLSFLRKSSKPPQEVFLVEQIGCSLGDFG